MIEKKQSEDSEPKANGYVRHPKWDECNSPGKMMGLPEDQPLRERMPYQKADNWAHRSARMRCRSCMYYAPKRKGVSIGRCRRNAPTMNGFPVVFETDWCGNHKIDEEAIG